MPADAQWLSGLRDRAGDLRERGGLAVVAPALGPLASTALRELAESESFEFLELDARVPAMLSGGALRALLRTGGAAELESLAAEAVGRAAGARAAWQRVQDRWGAGTASASAESLPLHPDEDVAAAAEAEVLARLLLARAELAPQCAVLRSPDSMDAGSARALRALLASGRGKGWLLVLDGAPSTGSWAGRLLAAVERSAADARLDGPLVVRLAAPAEEADAPAMPKRGTAVELLDLLASAAMPLPEAVVGAPSLAAYRGMAPRAGWLDLRSLLDAGRVASEEGWLRVIGGWSHTGADPGADGGSLPRADARALRAAVAEVLDSFDPTRTYIDAALAAAGGSPDAAEAARAWGARCLARGDGPGARDWLARAAAGGSGGAALALARARAARLCGNPEEARSLADAGASRAESEPSEAAALRLEAALALLDLGRSPAALKQLDACDEAAASAASSASVETTGIPAAAAFVRASLLESQGDAVGAATALASAARACEQAGDAHGAARAFARRAVCMGKAGAGDRAMKELKLAMERVPDADDPHPAALDVRVSIGLVMRDAGSRDKAKQALAMAADTASRHASPVREAEARVVLARFLLEGLPLRGPERGEALRDGREAAESALRVARGLGRADLEAEAETILGELSWRSEDWAGARVSLERQQLLWSAAARADKEVDAILRRSRLDSRRGDHESAFSAANQALQLALRKRFHEQSAHAQVARGEALESLKRGEDALSAYAEAQRLFSALGEAGRAAAGAAEERARKLVAAARAGAG
jgi:tetratricopeptide (TPR) repeat protein